MMIFSLVAMIGLEKCCITSAYLQWLCHSGERAVAHGPLVNKMLKTSRPGWSFHVELKPFKEEQLCVMHTLLAYLDKTKDVHKSNQLFISYCS